MCSEAHREDVVDKAGEIVEDAVHPDCDSKLQDLLGGGAVDGGQEVAAEGVGVHLQAHIVCPLHQGIAWGTCSSLTSAQHQTLTTCMASTVQVSLPHTTS